MKHLWIAGAVTAALFGAAAAGAAEAPGPRLAARLEPASITVGDPVAATIVLGLPSAASQRPAELVGLGEAWGEAELLAPPQVERRETAGGAELVWTIRLTAFRTGRIVLPPLVVRLAGDPPLEAATSGELALEVRSVLPSGDGELAAMPPAPPRPLAVPRAFWWALGGALAAIAVAAAFALRRRGAGAAPRVPVAPPLVELEKTLAALAGADPVGAHVAISRAVRRFLGRRLEFQAIESTTRQIARRLSELGLPPALAQRAVRLLGECDGVKFARRPASTADAAARAAAALDAALEVERSLAPPPPAVPPAAPGAAP